MKPIYTYEKPPDCDKCRTQIEQETAQKIFEDIEKSYQLRGDNPLLGELQIIGLVIMSSTQWERLKSKYGVK